MGKSKRPEGTRREFLRTTAGLAGAGGLIVMEPARVFGSQANSRINVGILGTGGRGRYDGRNIVKTGKAQVVALADYFDFQLTEPAQAFGVPEDRCFSGLEGFRQVLDLEEVDAVILAEPPFFRPYHFERAIAAGKHVFAEKPIAVDPWGCRKFLEMGKKAEQEQLTVVAGLQLRYDPSRREIADKIKNGAIGELILGHSQRMGGDLWRRERPSHFTERDHQIRHWLYYAWAGGDFIVEMHIHNLDVFNWFTGMLPASACGSGGRTVRTDVGDILDHLDVIYEYPNGFHLSHTGTQISKGFRGTESRIVGSEGFYDSETGLTSSDGEVFEQTRTVDMSEEEMLQFVDSILGTGPYLNNSEYVATSTFTCVLGRTAAYNGQKITWRDLWDSNQKIEFMESQL